MHTLALQLHMTVAQMTENMTMAEYAAWNEFFEERVREREDIERQRNIEREIAANKARGIVDFRAPDAGAQLIAQVAALNKGD